MRTFLVGLILVGIVGVSIARDYNAKAQGLVISSPHGVSLTNGIVRIDQWTCFQAPTAESSVPTSKPCPTRVELGPDVPSTALICRSTKVGQTCKTLGQLFPDR